MTAITGDDIVAIVDYFGAAWPWAEWSDASIAVWIDGLGDPNLRLDGDIALQVARRCARRWERPGSMAEYLAEYRNEAERRTATTKALDPPPIDHQGREQLLATMRQVLAHPRPHDHHHGAEGCATCVAAVQRDRECAESGCRICLQRMHEQDRGIIT